MSNEYVRDINQSGQSLKHKCIICNQEIKYGEAYYCHPIKNNSDIYHEECKEE